MYLAEKFNTDSPVPLAYSDVFVLTRSSQLQDDVRDDAGNVTSQASGVVRGLREAGLPVCVLGAKDLKRDRSSWERGVADTALAETDQITVTFSGAVLGLERRVVVWLPGRRLGEDDHFSEELVDAGDRLFGASRCTTQLVVVNAPGAPSESHLGAER